MSNYDNKRVKYKKTKNGNVKACNDFMRNLEPLVDERIQELADDEVEVMREEVEDIANNELQDYFSTVAQYMDIAEKPHLKDKGSYEFYTYNVFDRVIWFPLSKRTRARKRKNGGDPNSKWYSYNGKSGPAGGEHLQEYLNGKSFYETCEVDITQVDHSGGRGRPRKLKTYQLSLSIPLDEDTIIEEMGGFDDVQAQKAFGPHSGGINELRRPLFNPVAEYFMHQRIPRIIREAFKGRKYVEFS